MMMMMIVISLRTAGAAGIWINQSGFCRRKKLYCPDVKCMLIEVGYLPAWYDIKYSQKKIFWLQKLYQIVKSEKYETFCLFDLLIWR